MAHGPKATHFRLAVLLALGLACSPLCRGAEAPAAGPAPHVVLPLQLTAEGELSAAQRLAQQGRWDLALPMLQALLDRAPASLVHDGAVYRPLALVANRLLGASPPEPLRNYVLLYEPEAQKLCDEGVRARSAPLLREASRRYLHTPSGVRALGALAGLLMDEGQFGSALLVLGDADDLALAPADRSALSVRKIICLAHLGRRAEAGQVLEQLRGAGVDRLSVAGRNWEPGAFTDDAFAALAPPPSQAPAGPSVTAGDASGNAPLPAHEPDVAASISLDLPPGGDMESDIPAVPSTRAVATPQGICVVRNAVTFALTGTPPAVAWTVQAPGWALLAAGFVPSYEPLAPDAIPATSLSQWLTYGNYGLSTLSVAEGRLFAAQFDPAALQFPDSPWAATQDELRLTNQLSCFDAAGGKLLWSLGGGLPLLGAASSDYWFFTAPTVSDGCAFVLAARKGEVLALCLEADTGRVVWESPIGPLESRQEIERYWEELFLSDAGPPSVSDGVAVFPTGQGVVCAFDAWDGSPRWVSPYARAEALVDRLGQRLNVPAGSWVPRQPLIRDGLCLVTPSDSRLLLALSLRTGETRWQAELSGGVALLGGIEGRIYVQTRLGLRCVDLAGGGAVWQCDLGPAPGIGALGRTAVYVPQEGGVLPVEAATGRPGQLLQWPAGQRTWGNLTFCGDCMVAAAPDRVTVCPPAGMGRDPMQSLQHALTDAESAGDAARAAAMRRQLALRMAAKAVSQRDAGLLDKADAMAPRDADTLQELALARLRLALASPDQSDVAATYLDLCRREGSARRPGATASASFWTVLAAVVREECAGDPKLRAACVARFAAAAQQDEAARADLARWSPFPAASTAAPPPGEEPALRAAPTGRQAWSLDGVAVLPGQAESAGDPLLILQRGKLARVEPADGRTLWAADLPPPKTPQGWNPSISLPPPQLVGVGLPAYLLLPPSVTIATPAGFMSVDPGSGAVRWVQPADWQWAQPPVLVQVPRLELIERAQGGLPILPGNGKRTEPLDGFAANGSAACRLFAGRGLQAVDPASGNILLDLSLKNSRQTLGARVAAVGAGMAVLLQNPQRLLYFDFRGAQPLAEWRFRQGGFVCSMVAGPGGTLYLADSEGVCRLDVPEMTLAEKWIVDGGVENLVGADEEVVLVATLDGRLVGLSARDGRPLLDVAAQGATPLWAAHRGEMVYVLQANELRETTTLGREAHFSGSGFVFRALRLADGTELWRLPWPAASLQLMAPPRSSGGLWLLRSTQPGQVRIAGVDPATGKESLAVELEASKAPGPASLLVRDGRLIVGYDERLVALEAGAVVQ